MSRLSNTGDMTGRVPVMVDVSATPGADHAAIVTQLNSLLRGEISAAETYKTAIDKAGNSNDVDSKHVGTLIKIQEGHGRAAQQLRERIRALGGEPSDTSGAWGAWAKTVSAVASLFGDTSSLTSIREGEEHGLKDYREALDDVDPTSAEFMNQRIVQQQENISELNVMIEAVAARK